MPISRIYWSSGRDKDIHVVVGQPSPDLRTSFLAFDRVNPDGSTSPEWAKTYLDSNNDVNLKFKPLFKGTPSGDNYSDHGITVDTKKGIVTLSNPLPSPRKHNFILEAIVTDSASNNVIGTDYIRIHVHQSISQVWLTPATLTVRPFTNTRPETTDYKFSTLAQFDDGVVGDITDMLMPGISWTPAANVTGSGRLILTAGNNAGDMVAITVTLPAAIGGASATANIRIGEAWDPSRPIDASIVVGGGWPGTINPERVPNVLFLGDGFKEEDRAKFRLFINSLVQFLKKNPLNRPYDVLATSINFWMAFIPYNSTGVEPPDRPRGVSVNGEVYPVNSGGDLIARFVPHPEKPPDGHTGHWSLEQLIYMVGLPVQNDDLSNAARTNNVIKGEWQQLVEPDPASKVNNALINRWRRLAKRSLIDEVDSTLGVAVGYPVSNSKRNLINFHPNRMDRDKLDSLLKSLRDPRGIPINDLWAKRADGTKPNNYDLVCIVTAIAGRATNNDGYFFVDILDDNKIAALAGKNAFALNLNSADIPSMARNDIGRLLAHELTHSFAIEDEYGEFEGPPVGLTSQKVDQDGNVTLETDAKRGGNIHADEIKWNWHRVRKAAVINTPIEDVGGGKFKIPLLLGQGYQFALGDTVHLRYRKYPEPLIKNPKLSPPLEVTNPAPTSDSIHVKLKTGVTFTYPNTIGADQFIAEFPPESIVYIPTPAPESVRSDSYAYAEMVAKNIKDYMTNNQKPLTRYPSVVDDNDIQQPHIPGVSLPDCFSKNRTRIVGLYSGGKLYHKGIFHPTGNCMMRDRHKDGREFCAVCRYLLVDIIDPFNHWSIDNDYEGKYPQK